MIGVCTRYEEHLSMGSRITRDVITEQRRTDLIYQRCVPRSKPFPSAYCHYTRIIGNEQQEHDSGCNLSKPCKSKANPKPSRDLLSIKAPSTRIMIDQSHKGFGNYNSRSPYNTMNKRGLYPMKLGKAYSIMVTKSPARDGSLAVLQLAAAPRDDEASGVAFFLCLTRMDL